MSGAIRQIIYHVTIRGRVQGVGYRAWVEYEATARHLEGWVRNRRDGSVEAVFAGAEDVVSAMIASCRRGPPLARVDAVQDGAGNPDLLRLRGAGERFSVLPTL
jgi:acylphosphatase